MALSDGQNFVTLRQVVDDFIITMDSDDFISNVNDAAIRNIALRGIREFGFDVSSRVRSLKRTVASNNTVTLPDDYVDLVKLGVVGEDGVVHILSQNKNINYSQKMKSTGSTTDSSDGPLNIGANVIGDREDDKSGTSGTDSTDNDFDYYVFQNYLYQGGLGRLYGVGGGHLRGEYRVNLDQNRIEIDTESGVSEVVLEYVADEARSTNPVIHVYAEEALRCFMYYKLCERKSTVPANEKMRARAEYYNEAPQGKARLATSLKMRH
ncbi:MAG: hypothetical protein CM15mV74_470 [uncultured marine virus]|nr:MAG: hypothetical protein CM15mV74_470 [uncultured marine virus]